MDAKQILLDSHHVVRGLRAAKLLSPVFQKEAKASYSENEQPIAGADRGGIGGEKRFGSHARSPPLGTQAIKSIATGLRQILAVSSCCAGT
jgi:hypothetical protein